MINEVMKRITVYLIFLIPIIFITTNIQSTTTLSGLQFDDLVTDAPDRYEDAVIINKGDYKGIVNIGDDEVDYYKIYLNYGDRVFLTFSKNSSDFCELRFDNYIIEFNDIDFERSKFYSTVVKKSTYFRILINGGAAGNTAVRYDFSIRIEPFSLYLQHTFLITFFIALIIALDSTTSMKKLEFSVESGVSIIAVIIILYKSLHWQFSIVFGFLVFLLSHGLLSRRDDIIGIDTLEMDKKDWLKVLVSMLKVVIIPFLGAIAFSGHIVNTFSYRYF